MHRTLTLEKWRAEGVRLFGPDEMAWRFVCPACGFVASRKDWETVGAPDNAVAYSCIGRWVAGSRYAFEYGPGPCDYAGGGRLLLNPVTVVSGDVTLQVFDFADPSRKLEVAFPDSDVNGKTKYWTVRIRRKKDRRLLQMPRGYFSHVPATTGAEARAKIAARIRRVFPKHDGEYLYRSLWASYEDLQGECTPRSGLR